MSASGISSSSWFNYNAQAVQNVQQFRKGFQKLATDLKAGDLTSAQQDFVTLQQVASHNTSSSTAQSNPITQQLGQLSQDLQAGNLSAAQQDFAKIQQAYQNQKAQNHHHHHGGGSASSAVSQMFKELGQDLQAGNLSKAQQVYATLQQDFQGVGQSIAQTSTPVPTSTSTQQATEPLTQEQTSSTSSTISVVA